MLVLLFLTGVGIADEVILVTEEWPPYTYSEGDKPAGLVTEVLRHALKRTNFKWRIHVYPWARSYNRALTVKNTLIYTIFKLPSRERLFKWVKLTGLSTEMYLFSPRSRSDIRIDTLEDAKRYRIGVTRETSTHHFLLSKGFVEGKNLFPVSNEIQNAMKSSPERNRLDLTTGDRLSLAMWLKRFKFPADYWRQEIFLFREDFYIAFNLQTPDRIVSEMEGALSSISSDGTFQRILREHHREYGL